MAAHWRRVSARMAVSYGVGKGDRERVSDRRASLGRLPARTDMGVATSLSRVCPRNVGTPSGPQSYLGPFEQETSDGGSILNRGGAYAGRDNKGHQTVYNAPVTIHAAPTNVITPEHVVAPGESGYMTAYEVVHYLADRSRWGANRRVEQTSDGAYYPVLLEAFVEFPRRARNGGVRAQGRLNGLGQHQNIASNYWLSASFDHSSVLRRDDIARTAPAVPNGASVPIYEDPHISREDVEREWPPADWRCP